MRVTCPPFVYLIITLNYILFCDTGLLCIVLNGWAAWNMNAAAHTGAAQMASSDRKALVSMLVSEMCLLCV